MKTAMKIGTALLGAGLLFPFLITLVGPAGAQTWTQLVPSGSPPVAREEHTAVYDGTSNRMIVFGGTDPALPSGPAFNDIWVLTDADGLGGPPAWTQLAPTGGPSKRKSHSAVYDATNNRMVVFGGDLTPGSCFGATNEVWVLDHAAGLGGTPAWTQLSPAGGLPGVRADHTAVYDAVNNRMIVFGGYNLCVPPSPYNDVWVLENANGLGGTPAWTQLSPAGGPPPGRTEHTAVYDVANNRMIVFSGCEQPGSCPADDLWVLENANGLVGTPAWTQLFPTGGPPPLRSLHTAIYDEATNRMTVFGGDRAAAPATGNRLNDVWVLENANGLGGTPTWLQVAPTGGPPNARDTHTAVHNPATNRMTVFAGRTCTANANQCYSLNDVWVLTDANGIVEITVTIDIKPGSFPNSINLRSRGTIPVAILSSIGFDASAQVDRTSLSFGRTGDEPSLAFCNSSGEDVNGDGFLDLVCHFHTQTAAFQSGDTQGILKGQTVAGTPLTGTDSIHIVPSK